MHPILLKLGPLTIHTYGLMIALGFLAGTSVSTRLAKREGVDPQLLYDLIFYLMLSAIAGSRLLYVLISYEHYLAEPWRAFKIWEGGLVFYGGLIGAIATAVAFTRLHRMPLMPTADLLAPGIALGHAIGRVGCLMAGCCYGAPTNLPWGITFTNPNSLAPLGVALHPTQIYSSLEGLTIFGILMLLRRRQSFKGQIFLSYIAIYSVTRFFIEFLRGDERGGVGLLSTSQFISIIMLAIALLAYRYIKSQKAQSHCS